MIRTLKSSMRRKGPIVYTTPKRPFIFYMVGMSFLSFLYIVFLEFHILALLEMINAIGPVLFFIINATLIKSLVKHSFYEIWSPLFWLLVSFSVYYGLGPLIHIFGSTQALEHLQRSLPVSVNSEELMAANLLVSVGACVTIGFAFFARRYFSSNSVFGRATPSDSQQVALAKTVAACFLSIGLFLNLFLILPVRFGLRQTILPGVLTNLGELLAVGIMLLAYLATLRGGVYRLLFFAFFTFNFMISVISFSKGSIVLSLLLPAIGSFLAHNRLRRFFIQVFVIALIYFLSIGLVDFGRSELRLSEGYFNRGSPELRLSLVIKYFSGSDASTHNHGNDLNPIEETWARINYVPAQVYAMEAFNFGQSGQSYQNVLIAIVPRVLWPNKPVVTDVGQEVYRLVTGNDLQSWLGLGIFGEAYWNLGWLGLVFACAIFGTSIGIISNWSAQIVLHRKLHLFPAVLLGIQIGLFGAHQFFAASVLPGTILYFLLIFTFSFIFNRFSR